MNVLSANDIFINTCENHHSLKVMAFILSAISNTLLNDYCKVKCNAIPKKSNKRKSATLSTS